MKIACLSDCHGNLYALEKALTHIRNINPDHTVFMGDAVGYIPGMQCVRVLRDAGIPCLKGNHEDMLLNGGYSAERNRVYRHSETLETASADDLDVIRAWPEQLTLGPVFLAHGGPGDLLNEYIYPDTDLAPLAAQLPGDVTICVTAHTHRPFIREDGNRVFVNAGSVGLPRDDGRYGAFAMIDTESGHSEILRFDIRAETARSIAEFGPVHDSVVALGERTLPALTGKMVA